MAARTFATDVDPDGCVLKGTQAKQRMAQFVHRLLGGKATKAWLAWCDMVETAEWQRGLLQKVR
jgi:hypothetical protein